MLALIAAFLLDLWIGDPVYAYHPVRIIGKAVAQGEWALRKWTSKEKLAGALLAFGVPVLVFILTWMFLALVEQMNFAVFWVLNVFGIYSTLSVHDLKKEALRIYEDLKKNDLTQARRDLARIVGRDTENLDEKEIVRASVETVAESTVDGIAAPLFYAALGGAPLALAYKAVNTLDSMIGHKNERYRQFGYFAAKQDEFWNWIPARLAYLAIGLAAFFAKGETKEAWRAGWKDGLKSGHGISAIPEAAFAGAMNIQLGGRNSYQGRFEDRPFLGEGSRDFSPEHIPQSLILMNAAAWLILFLCLVMMVVVGIL